MLKELQSYFDKEDYYVKVMEEVQFNGFSVLKCKEYNPIGKPEYFDIIQKDGKFYNQNFDDIVELNESCKI